MSIRLLAQELYKSQQVVDRLTSELAAAPMEKKAEVADALRKARAERDFLRRALKGEIGR